MMTTCEHDSIREIEEWGYTHCVAPDDCNGASHGCVSVVYECTRCGARRSENVNWWHVETGPWGPSAAERRATERRDAERRAAAVAERRRAVDETEDAAARAAGAAVVDRIGDCVLVRVRDRQLWTDIAELRAAASQPVTDPDDGLPAVYRSLVRAAEGAIS